MNSKLILFFSLLLIFSSCSTNKKKEQSIDPNKDFRKGNLANQGLEIVLNSDSDSKKAGDLETAYFDFKSINIGVHLQTTLDKDAHFLLAHQNIGVRLEGNCDERGSVQINLALGDKRAKYVRDFLINKGVEPSRISIISYGKERPISFGHDEDSWSINRRVNFVITKV
ncbi:MAG: OmpA family protein [Bacteriovorax sp.]